EWDTRGRIVAHHLGPPQARATTRWSYAAPEHTTPSLVVEPGGAETRIEVSGDDLAVSVTDADGVRAELAYDADGQMTSVTDALGNVTPGASWSYEWSRAGRALAGADPAGGPWRASYGNHGALSSITAATGEQTGFSYDAYGNIVQIAGADGRVYHQGFDGLSQLVS